MIRTTLSAAVVALLLSGCTVPLKLPLAKTCRTEATIGYIGQTYTKRIGRIVKDKAQATYVRTIAPDMMVTQEFRENRVNIALDERGHVSRIYCG